MMVFPATSTVVVPGGIEMLARGPTATMRSPRIRIAPSVMMPPSREAIVTIRAPVSASIRTGLSATTSIVRDIPVRGATNGGASSSAGASRNNSAVVAVNSVGPIVQWMARPLFDQLMKSPPSLLTRVTGRGPLFSSVSTACFPGMSGMTKT